MSKPLGKVDDLPAEVEMVVKKWKTLVEENFDEWYEATGWYAKYVEMTFIFKGIKYSILPDMIGLRSGYTDEEAVMEYLENDIHRDLKAIGATEIRHYGFID